MDICLQVVTAQVTQETHVLSLRVLYQWLTMKSRSCQLLRSLDRGISGWPRTQPGDELRPSHLQELTRIHLNRTVSDILKLVTYGKATRAITKTKLHEWTSLVFLSFFPFKMGTLKVLLRNHTWQNNMYNRIISTGESFPQENYGWMSGWFGCPDWSPTSDQTSVREARAQSQAPTIRTRSSKFYAITSDTVTAIWGWLTKIRCPLRYTNVVHV